MNPAPLILVVEDDLAIRDAVAETLADEGYRVHLAANGADALAWVAAGGRPDAAVVDLVMPVMGGGELLGRLRADPAVAGVPVLLTTAALGTRSAPLPRADGLLEKPFDLDQLLAAVERLVARR